MARLGIDISVAEAPEKVARKDSTTSPTVLCGL
jgi:hypothetical protein